MFDGEISLSTDQHQVKQWRSTENLDRGIKNQCREAKRVGSVAKQQKKCDRNMKALWDYPN